MSLHKPRRHAGRLTVQHQPFLTLTLHEGEWSASRSSCFIPKESPSSHWTGSWVGPRAGLNDQEKHESIPQLGFQPQIDLVRRLVTILSTQSWLHIRVLIPKENVVTDRRKVSNIWYCSIKVKQMPPQWN